MSSSSPLYKMDDEAFRGYLTKVADAADDAEVEICQLHSVWPMDDTTEEGRQDAICLYARTIEAAHHLRCKYVVIHPTLPFGWELPGDEDVIRQCNFELCTALMPYARKYGVTVCVENLPFRHTKASSKVAEIKRLVRAVNDPHLKVCLDTGHANIHTQDIGEDVRLLGEDLAALHVHDNNGGGDMHYMPYHGTLEWEKLFTALKEIGYKGCFTLEMMISPATPEPVLEEMRLSLSKLTRMMADKIE